MWGIEGSFVMIRYFIPYTGSCPALVNINGHRLLVVSCDAAEIEDSLDLFGADSIRSVEGESGARGECRRLLEELAEEVEGGVVIAPDDVELAQILTDLEAELPWIQ
ncbi:MAG: hypothetical protein KDD60_04725 [Bdellovibrionales bacterium]|nr:hypothetical protein [Bdellovibrionales bacterium]